MRSDIIVITVGMPILSGCFLWADPHCTGIKEDPHFCEPVNASGSSPLALGALLELETEPHLGLASSNESVLRATGAGFTGVTPGRAYVYAYRQGSYQQFSTEALTDPDNLPAGVEHVLLVEVVEISEVLVSFRDLGGPSTNMDAKYTDTLQYASPIGKGSEVGFTVELIAEDPALRPNHGTRGPCEEPAEIKSSYEGLTYRLPLDANSSVQKTTCAVGDLESTLTISAAPAEDLSVSFEPREIFTGQICFAVAYQSASGRVVWAGLTATATSDEIQASCSIAGGWCCFYPEPGLTGHYQGVIDFGTGNTETVDLDF